jgi:uncharacterized cupin superfamily protein
MVFHYHVQREELLIVLEGLLSLRSAAGWEELPEGDVVAFPVASVVPTDTATTATSRCGFR